MHFSWKNRLPLVQNLDVFVVGKAIIWVPIIQMFIVKIPEDRRDFPRGKETTKLLDPRISKNVFWGYSQCFGWPLGVLDPF